VEGPTGGDIARPYRNLFDAEYETISGYNVAPRIAMLGVDLRF